MKYPPDPRRAERIGRMVQSRRQAKGWTQDYLGFRVGVGRKQIGGIEQGLRWPSAPTLVRLVLLLNLDLLTLNDDEG